MEKEMNKKENDFMDYCVGGFMDINGQRACHDSVTVGSLSESLRLAESYFNTGFPEVRISQHRRCDNDSF